jgi:alkylation response protein AidB-like acyl-CoA dehydrogenase
VANIELDDEQIEVAQLARQLGLEVMSPAAAEAETNHRVPEDVWQTIFGTGLTVPVPEELGGAGIGDAATLMIALENLAYGDAGITTAAFASGAAALLLARHGRPVQTDIVRRLTADPRARAALALYEPYGRGAGEFATTITDIGGGAVRVQGRKVAVAYPDQANPLVVVGADAANGDVRAVVLTPNVDGVTTEKYRGTLGLGAVGFGAITVDTEVPAEWVLGAGDDADTLLDTIGVIRLAVAAIAVGTAAHAIDYAARYATERVAFGNPISAFQGVAFPLAEARMRIDAARLEISEIAGDLDAAAVSAAAERAVSVTRAVHYACQVATEATRTAVQTLGGHGFIAEHPVERWYRSAAALSTLDADPLCTAFQPAL